MSSESPDSHQMKPTSGDDASSDAAGKLPTSAGEIAQEGRSETPDVLEGEALRTGIRDDGLGHVTNEGALMDEVRSSLHTISNGVEELSATFQDLLGLSDSDSSGDYDVSMDGRRRFSWAKLKLNARWRRRQRKELKHAQEDTQQTGTDDDTESDDQGRKQRREVIPEVRQCDFKQFQSRRAGDSHKSYCIDILVADESLSDEMFNFDQTIESWKPAHISNLTESSNTEDHSRKWIRRIRINSRAVMEMLQHVCPGLKGRKGRPAIFYRPFQLLVYSQKEVKERLTHIRELATNSSSIGQSPTDSKGLLDSPKSKTPDWDTYVKKLGENQHLLEQLTCFVDFMESEIMPDSRRYRDPSSSRPRTIRYEDLWYLFKPGDLVYLNQDPPAPERFVSKASAHRILRVIQTSLTSTNIARGPLGLPHVAESRWSILGHFIEYDGDSYVPIHFTCRPILPFRGETKVTELPVYPIAYLEDDQIMSQGILDGATYVRLIERRSGFYSGWTQTASPFGIRLKQDPQKSAFVSPEHIESDILVDFQETFNAFPDWRPVAYSTKVDDVNEMEANEFRFGPSDLPLIEWDREVQTRHERFDQALTTDETEVVEAKKFLMEDALGQFRKHRKNAPTGQYLALLPKRFFAYAVLERKFVQLNTRFVRNADVEANDKAFKKLEIDQNYKRLILSLVKSHFDKIETEKKTNVEIETQDLIRGKGKGVVILLHGVPGVGKTATAEAVALKWKKPLFPITCGDLGYTAETLEKSLHEIFRLAHHWGCILLLDEADVFITQRERHDLKRNALVSGKNHNIYFELDLVRQKLKSLKHSSGS